ncbi:MAG: 50S ribosomal protein L4 [Patescibacteria group bacterium]|nr:50S ribosomal protein L4 [Patescibacteria group bacterium]
MSQEKQDKKIKTGKTKRKEIIEENKLTIPLYNLKGEEKGKIELPKEIFDAPVNKGLIAQYVRVYLANQRKGTVSTKTRSEVSGSTRKIYRQKGTGRARHGDIKAPIFVGGGIAFGPKQRDYSLKINKKQKRKVFLGALTLKQKEKSIIGLDDEFLKIKLKTKLFYEFLKKLKLEKEKILLIFSKKEKNNLLLAARNLSNVELSAINLLNSYQILKNKFILITNEALTVLKNHFLIKNEIK